MINKKSNLESFQKFEAKNNCFDYRVDGIYIWDIIRYQLYLNIHQSNQSSKESKKRVKPISSSLFQFAADFLFFIYSVCFKKWTYLFFTASRNKYSDNIFFDQNLSDILKKYKKTSFFLESFERNRKRILYDNVAFNPIDIIKEVTSKFFKKKDYSTIISLIHKEFENQSFNNDTINNIINKHRVELLFYSILLKIKKPKIIFITQNGIQKALFAIAKERKIPVIEVQHGTISDHVGYNYSSEIMYKGFQIHVPTYFFVFSKFWKEQINYPVKKILEMGNSSFFNVNLKTDNSQKLNNGLIVVSANIYGLNLKNIIVDLCSQYNVSFPIYFKLHPNQYLEKENFISDFLPYNNVQVLSSEKNMTELLSISKAVLVINSTALYESLHRKKMAIIYKKQTYLSHKDVFNNSNVHLIDNAEDLITVMSKNYIEDLKEEDVFFKDFNEELFHRFMSDIGITLES